LKTKGFLLPRRPLARSISSWLVIAIRKANWRLSRVLEPSIQLAQAGISGTELSFFSFSKN
jgi:hypothetical protein